MLKLVGRNTGHRWNITINHEPRRRIQQTKLVERKRRNTMDRDDNNNQLTIKKKEEENEEEEEDGNVEKQTRMKLNAMKRELTAKDFDRNSKPRYCHFYCTEWNYSCYIFSSLIFNITYILCHFITRKSVWVCVCTISATYNS